MVILKSLFTSFGKVFSKPTVVKATAKTAGVVKKAKNLKIAKAGRPMAIKPAAIATQTKIATQVAPSGYFKGYAQSISNSKIVRPAAKAATAGVIVGSGIYGAGVLGQKGISAIGYGWRDFTGNQTTGDMRADALADMAKEQDLQSGNMDLLERYQKFLTENALTDMPSAREAFDNFIIGDGSNLPGPQENFEDKSNLGAFAIFAGSAVALTLFLTRKKKSKK